jgi:hypothetical protein
MDIRLCFHKSNVAGGPASCKQPLAIALDIWHAVVHRLRRREIDLGLKARNRPRYRRRPVEAGERCDAMTLNFTRVRRMTR